MLASFSPVRSPAEQDICHLNGIAGARFFVAQRGLMILPADW
jgi:hypothetical protein